MRIFIKCVILTFYICFIDLEFTLKRINIPIFTYKINEQYTLQLLLLLLTNLLIVTAFIGRSQVYNFSVKYDVLYDKDEKLFTLCPVVTFNFHDLAFT